MKKIFIAAIAALFMSVGKVGAQADPFINIVTSPGSLAQNASGTLQINASNLGGTDIVANSLEIVVTAGTNAEITGVMAGSDTRWTQSSITTGVNNTIRLRNNSTIPGFDGGDIDLTVVGRVVASNGMLSGSIGYLPGPNPLLAGSAISSTQGNGQLGNDASSTSLIVTTGPLPVHLLSFDGKPDGCNVQISWGCSEERTTHYYELETSIDGSNFKLAKSIKAQGIDGKATYTTLIPQLMPKALYRLKIPEANGAVTYSKTIGITTQCNDPSVSVYPNPTTGSIFINGLKNRDLVRIYDQSGKVVKNSISTESSAHIDLSNLPAGSYRAVINGATKITSLPVLKVNE